MLGRAGANDIIFLSVINEFSHYARAFARIGLKGLSDQTLAYYKHS
jgi:hypothetical protein